MLYFILLLISSLNTALAARPKCSPQYSAIANYISDYEPAVAWCSSKIAGRTSTVTVTQTIRRQQKREAAPTSASDDAVPANLFAYAASHSKPRPNNDDAGQLARPHVKAPRQYNANWANYYYNMMQSQSQASSPWVRAVCSCVVTPRVATVTRTSTTIVAGYFPLPTTSSTRHLSSLPSSDRPSSAYELPNNVRSSTTSTTSTARSTTSSSSAPVYPYLPSTSIRPSSAYELPNSIRSSPTSTTSTTRSTSSSSAYPYFPSTSIRPSSAYEIPNSVRSSTTSTASTAPSSSSSSVNPYLPSTSIRPSSAYELPSNVRSSTISTVSTAHSSSTSVYPYFPSTSVRPSSAYEIPNSVRSSTPSAASTARSSSSTSTSSASVYPYLSSTSIRFPTTSNPPPGPPTANSAPASAYLPPAPPSSSAYLPPAPPSGSAYPSVLPATPLADKNCTTGTYQGTGACACEYTVVCGYTGNCGAASEAATSSAATWQQCAQTCDDNSACSAWTYSVTSGTCTEVVDPNCDTSGFVSIAAGDSVLGVYGGACGGVCLI